MSLRRHRPNYSAIGGPMKNKEMYWHTFLDLGVRLFQLQGLSDKLMHWQLVFLVQVRL